MTQQKTGGAWALAVMAVALLGAWSAPASAASSDPLIEGGRLCTQHFPVEERKNNIPTHLLAAISTTESGRWHQGLGMAVPWPWTINVDGKGYYFDNKAQAIAQTRNFMAQGHESIDVGCMQVNLKHHAKAFRTLEEAFDPQANVAYAAKFLHDNYAELGDWIKATAAYHSRTSSLGQRYLAEIEKSWNRIVTKVAQARAAQGVGGAAAATADTNQQTASLGAAPVEVAPKMRPIRDTHNVKVIQVGERPAAARNDVLVIRPAAPVAARPTAPVAPSAPAVATVTPSTATAQAVVTPVKLADASGPVEGVVTPVAGASDIMVKGGDSVRRVSLGAAPVAPAASSGPKFVFAN